MGHPLMSDPAADSFVTWAQQARPGLTTLQQALCHPQREALQAVLGEHGANAPEEAIVTLLACVGQLQEKSPVLERHYRQTGVDFVAVWALASPLRETSKDPNEQRFLTWATAQTWEAFFEASVIGVRVLMTYRRPFDLRSLYRWVMCRAENPQQFDTLARDSFATWQAPADWLPDVDASRHDHAHCRAIIDELLHQGWERQALSERLGITPQYLGLITREKRSASYGLQVCLELLRGPVEAPTLSKSTKSNVA